MLIDEVEKAESTVAPVSNMVVYVYPTISAIKISVMILLLG
jgi:hypothetical protein